jgi:TonB family protein
MLRTLLESKSRRANNELGTAASAAVHLTLIVLAAFATASGAPRERERETPIEIQWVDPQPAPATAVTGKTPAATNTASTSRPIPSISVAISTNIPPIDIPLGGVQNDDFPISTGSAGESRNAVATGPASEQSVYDAYEVDKGVAAISGVAPAYPASMRASGIEGEVKAQFVVNERGRAEVSSLRIVSSTNDQFSEAVRQALPRMRFRPAELRGHPVAQMVQQLFSFRLDR